jgi:AsmA protein
MKLEGVKAADLQKLWAKATARQKQWIRIAAAAFAAVILIVVLIPFMVSADTFRPMLQKQLSSALGREITLSHLSFSLFSESLVAKNISIADDPAFSSAPFIEAKSLDIGVEVMPFLFHRQVRITRLTIESPAIQLIQAQRGTWNFSSIGSAQTQASQQQSSLPDLTVGELSIKDGSATVSSLPPAGKPFVYSKVNLDVKQFSFAKSFAFELSASLPGDGSLELTGAAGPLAQNNAADTPFHATLQIKHLDPVAAGVVQPGEGIAMVADIDARVQSAGSVLTSSGKIQAVHLKLSRTGSPAPNPVNLDYNVAENLAARTGQVSDLAVHTGSVAVHVTGGFRLTPQAVVLNLRLAAPNLPVDQLEQLLPVVGVHLPSGSSLHGGTLTANLAINGPATATTITGPIEIDNTQLAGFSLASKIEGLNPLGGSGSGNGTAIEHLRTTVTSTPQSTQFANIDANVPAIGTATGSGTVSSAEALDFNLVAKLNSTSGVGAVATQATSLLGGFFGKAVQTRVNNGVPLTITGTASDPRIRANMKAMLK